MILQINDVCANKSINERVNAALIFIKAQKKTGQEMISWKLGVNASPYICR